MAALGCTLYLPTSLQRNPLVPAGLKAVRFASNTISAPGRIVPRVCHKKLRKAETVSAAADGSKEFYKVEALVRPWRLNLVASALLRAGIRGVTVTDVRGFGAQGGSRERQAGSEFTEDSFVSKAKLEIVVSQDQVETVIDIITSEARTGEIGDGKIFVSQVADIVRIRTGERGIQAERMAGGRAELLSSIPSDER